jgi:hypothetical protein
MSRHADLFNNIPGSRIINSSLFFILLPCTQSAV